MRGREGGTLDEMRASMWVAEVYRRIGLRPMGEDSSYFQWFDIVRTRVSTTASRVSVGGQALALFRDAIPLGVVPAEASGTVLWIADASDTTVDVSGKVVATPLLTPAPATIRPNSYPEPVRYADAAVTGTVARFVRRGAAAAADELSVINMGGDGAESQDNRATEASVRGFWKAYRRHMGF
jgi:hypothetical protein